MPIDGEGNILHVRADFSAADSSRLLASMHKLVSQRGYQDIELDFSECTSAFAPDMVAICATCQSYWKGGVDISLRLPTLPKLERLFRNANWAHLIDFRNFDECRPDARSHVPTMRFSNGKEQFEAVDKLLNMLLSSIGGLQRDGLRAMEWSLNEITDNVINHAQSAVGGFVQLTNYKSKSQVEFIVCDSGLGIPGTLRPTHPELRSDVAALEAAIREGVTRDKAVGQGNGLFGSYQIAMKGLGGFRLISGWASLISAPGDLRIVKREVPFNGTLVVCRIGYGLDIDLTEALVIDGRVHEPADYVETHFKTDDSGAPIFDLGAESEGFGSRSSGAPIRSRLANVVNLTGGGRVIVDMADVALVSSSYADEVFGKLFVELGPVGFSRSIEIRNVDPLVKGLIDKAIMQRVRQMA